MKVRLYEWLMRPLLLIHPAMGNLMSKQVICERGTDLERV